MMGHSWGTRVDLVGFGGSGRVASWPVFFSVIRLDRRLNCRFSIGFHARNFSR
jgi:hypothetical protein